MGATVVCDCCELDVPEKLASPLVNAYGLLQGARCRRCNEHQGDALKKAEDHEDEVRIRWGKTIDELHETQDRADEYERRMKSALKSRTSVLREFDKLSRYHHTTDHGCSCGVVDCETRAIVEADWIQQLIRNVHERGGEVGHY
jgi:hypothetical protein